MINENILTELKQLKQSIEEVSVYDLNVYSSMELYSRVAGKINELIKEVMTYQGILSEELLKELDYINNHMDTFLYEIRTNSEMAINDMNIAKNEMIEQVTIQINENQLLINSLLNYSNRLTYLERMLDLLFSENVSHRTKLLLEGNHLSLTNSKEGLIQVNSTTGNTLVNCINYTSDVIFTKTNNSASRRFIIGNDTLIKENTTYTVIYNVSNLDLDGTTEIGIMLELGGFGLNQFLNYIKSVGINKAKFTTSSRTTTNTLIAIKGTSDQWENSEATTRTITIKDIIILEGDYTNKPIPDYFTGMQSTFEDKVVTQEMVDSGKELAENLGKYRVDYKVTGKNKFDGKWELGTINQDTGYESFTKGYIRSANYISIRPNTTYKASSSKLAHNNVIVWGAYDKNYNYIEGYSIGSIYTTPSNARYIKVRTFQSDSSNITLECPLQIEEGSTATEYEPYKEFTKTYYLNSPLLEGDTIEESNGNIYHVHRYGKVVLNGSENWEKSTDKFGKFFCKDILNFSEYNELSNYLPTGKSYWSIDETGFYIGNNHRPVISFNSSDTKSNYDITEFKNYLNSNPLTVIYKLASPTREVISENDDLMMKCFNGCSIDYDSIIPVEITDVTFTGEGTSSTNLLVDDVNLETDEITREV